MKIKHGEVQSGEWIRIENGAPPDLRPVEVQVGTDAYPGFIEGRDVLIRCPHGYRAGSVLQVAVNGVSAGRVVVK